MLPIPKLNPLVDTTAKGDFFNLNMEEDENLIETAYYFRLKIIRELDIR